MDRAILERHLAQVEEHIALGEYHIAHQRKLVGEMERDGHDTREAKRLLDNLEKLQEMHLLDRDRVRQKLTQNS